MTKIFAFSLLFLVSGSIGAATSNLKKGEETNLTDGPVKVRVFLEGGRTVVPCPNANSWRWGSEQACPEQRISSFEVSYQKQSVFIPYSAFADLGNPSSISIERGTASNVYSVRLLGGDAASSYSVVLKFKGGLLLEKMVRHGEFPENSWEKTLYKFNIMQ